MSTTQENIKKDIYSLYSILYNKHHQASLSGVLSDEIIKLLKYELSDVEDALAPDQRKNKQSEQKVSVLKDVIQGKDDVYNFFRDNLEFIFNPTTSEDKVTQALSKITITDLKYLYSFLVDVPLSGKLTKKDLIYKIRDFFDSEKRTHDLYKNLL